ncbi:sigma-E factor negative regulatory protein [Variovorax saccharolyticus]|uniref:sigma-E factor negative regulatory protein n=1 Tax=Variovorax saccharolyticus TaxID=3053516 RepID=UPI002577F528|nr:MULTISPECIES: sigma-E factor negative regulatory protein [unclassified Variovorax]MDM0018598.1 sigma-E factor negative regulatory protein [Variovorax sp. J22R187]MDM0024210.1 sigma-E factor negative regulatory protein [Variovorax sp. J31P216]
MNQTNTVQEQVSALADGHLPEDEFAEVVGKLCVDPQLRASWQTYHLVGDVLRSGAHTVCSDSSAFLSRFQSRLAAEPALPALVSVPTEVRPVRAPVEAANEPVFRWKLVAGAASLAAAAAIGWNWVGGAGSGAAGAQLALQRAAPAVVATAEAPAPAAPALSSTRVMIGNGNPQVMLRDPRLDQLLEAHQQAGGASQMPSGFLRNATFDRPSR